MGRIWQCGTIQLDMNLPQRFDLYYIDKDGEKRRPIMIHRACLGSIERFTGIIIEHFAGAFPTWLAPIQVTLLPVNNEFHLDYTNELFNLFQDNDIRVIKDDANEKLGYRLRNAQIKKIPYTIVIGDNEVKDRTVTYRKYSSKEQVTVTVDEFLKLIKEEIASKAR